MLTNLKQGILTITVNRPDKRKALNAIVIDKLSRVIGELYKDPGIKAAIITGAGETAFVTGADISEFQGLNEIDGAALARRGKGERF